MMLALLRKWLNTIARVVVFASPSGQLRVRQEAISTTEPSSSTEKQPKHSLLDTLSQTRAERLRPPPCNSSDGEPKLQKQQRTSKPSKASGKGSKPATNPNNARKRTTKR
jgi:hypothetical protein